jgi:hypothetical protein
MFCVPILVFGDIEGDGSRIHVLRPLTRFWRYRGRQVPFSCFAQPDTFSAVRRASGLVFMFCAPGLVFGGTDGVHSRFHVFALLDTFSAVRRASGPVFMFCALGHVFGGSEGVGFHFHVLHSLTHFQRYRGRRVPFSCFALPDTFSTVRKASGPVFMFCATRHVFGGAEGVGSRFHVLRARTHFRRYRRRPLSFSCFALPDTVSAVPRASAPVFMFCAPGLIFSGTERDGSCFHVFRPRTRFWQCGRRRVPFSCFSPPNTFLAVWKASGPVFMFCTAGHVFGSSEGVGFRFHVLRPLTRFWRY